MPLICVCSPKGGVGKTTLAANLAYSLARTGSKVLALDFDVQNALRLHFGVPLNDERGYVAKALELGLIINAPNDTSIRLAPPLIVGDTEIAEFVQKFTEALTAASTEA